MFWIVINITIIVTSTSSLFPSLLRELNFCWDSLLFVVRTTSILPDIVGLVFFRHVAYACKMLTGTCTEATSDTVLLRRTWTWPLIGCYTLSTKARSLNDLVAMHDVDCVQSSMNIYTYESLCMRNSTVLSVCVVFAAVWRAFAGNVNDFFRVMYMMLV